MASYKDTPNKQIADDYNLLHAEDVGFVPLLDTQFTITKVKALPAALPGGQNTSCTLVITAPDENYSADIHVRYRRLDLSVAYPPASRTPAVYGKPSTPTVTQEEIYAIVDKPIGLGLIRLINPATNPIVMNNGVGPHTIVAPLDDPQFMGSVTLNCGLKQYDIGAFAPKPDEYSSYDPFQRPMVPIKTDTDILQLILDHLVLKNASLAPQLNKAAVSYELVNSGNAGTNKIKVTVIDLDNVFKGQNTFEYSSAYFPLLYNQKTRDALAADPNQEHYNWWVAMYDNEQMLTELLEPIAATHDLQLPATEPVALLPIPRQKDTINGFSSYVWLTEPHLAYGPSMTFCTAYLDENGDIKQNPAVGGVLLAGAFSSQTINPIKYEFEFSMTLSQTYAPGALNIFADNRNYYFPTTYTLDIVSAPVGATPFTQFTATDSGFSYGLIQNSVTMIPGTYRIKISSTDWYTRDRQDDLRYTSFYLYLPNPIPVTIHKHTSPIMVAQSVRTPAIAYTAGAFDDCIQTMNFEYDAACNWSLADWNRLKSRCTDFAGIISATMNVSTVPTTLFEDMYAWQNNLSSFTGLVQWITNHPGAIIRNIPFLNLPSIFDGMTALPSTDIFAFVGPRNQAPSLRNLFAGVETVAIQPEQYKAWFDHLTGNPRKLEYWGGAAQGGDLSGLFSYNVGISTIVPNFFDKYRGTGVKMRLNTMFSGSSISDIPAGLFDGLTISDVSGMFQNCKQLIRVPDNLFVDIEYSEYAASWLQNLFNGSNLTYPPVNMFKPGSTVTQTYQTFYNTKLIATPSDFYQAFPNLTAAYQDFYGCYDLTTVSPTLYTDMSALESVQGSFTFCTALGTVPATLFQDTVNLEIIQAVFEQSGLSAIPTGFLDTTPKITTARAAFYGTKIQSIPPTLFNVCTELTSVNQVFSACSELLSIPENLFINNPLITDASGAFANTAKLTTIPAGLLTPLVNLTDASTIFNASSITSIPATLFSTNTELTTLYNAFSSTQISTIPAGLFDGLVNVTNISGMFSWSPLLSVPSQLLGDMVNVTDATFLFRSCNDLPTVPVDLFDGVGSAGAGVRIVGAFNECSALASVPAGLLRNPNITDISSLFRATGLITVPNLFAGGGGGRLTDVGSMFYGTAAMTSWTPGLFNDCQSINSLSFLFYAYDNTMALTTINTLYHVTTASPVNTIDVSYMFSFNQKAPPPAGQMTLTGPLFTTDKSLLTIRARASIQSFLALKNQTFNINQLLGTNVRLDPSGNEFSGFVNMTGSGANFIANNLVVGDQTPGLFRGCTGLSDYASLPSWAK